MDLKGKVVLITGSATGIGKETAILCAKKGAHVVVTFHSSQAEGEKTFAECNKHAEAMLLRLEVSDFNSCRSVVLSAIKKFGKLDVLINNAGILQYKPLHQQKHEEIAVQIQTNLTGAIWMTYAALANLRLQKEAMIINVASAVGIEPHENASVYCASKFGLRGFTQCLALELPKHIKIFAVNPGLTATKMTDYQGIPPEKVGGVIIQTIEETLNKKSGDDINVWEVRGENKW